MPSRTDTIAAIATAPGRGGVGLVRVSGRRTADVLQGVLGRMLAPRHATFGVFRAADRSVLDQGVAILYPAPSSYTGEDVLELFGHGGPAVLGLVLSRCLELGARLAAPGEFTERAFLNGKLDLAQAEAVADLIDASTIAAARAAARSLSGDFSREIAALSAALIELRTLTEAALDFPEEDIDFVRAADAAARLAGIEGDIGRLLQRARQGALLREGVSVVLVGQPNVGKSSLMNRLAREDVAIVTAIAGTTRDTLRASIEIAGIPLTIVDTAGLRPTNDPIETIGIERTWAAIEQAGLALLIVDARQDGAALGAEDEAILARVPSRVPWIIVHNKIDLVATAPKVVRAPDGPDTTARWDVWISAREGTGVDALRAALRDALGAEADLETAFIARTRHVDALTTAERHVRAAGAELAGAVPALELFAEHLREAHHALGAIVGEFTADDLLGAIFARFCIGK